MQETLDTVLLLALPASGKSEVRRYLEFQTPETCRTQFHMGPTVQLDDFPYVHMMRRIDDELAKVGKARLFFASSDKPFINPIDWGTLIELINEDYVDLVNKTQYSTANSADALYTRMDKAAAKVGGPARYSTVDEATRKQILPLLEPEARKLMEDKLANYTDLKGKTLVIEAARGGKQGSSMPLPKPFGYEYSLAQLHPDILKKAVILYIWVTPEESRRKNSARTNPNDPGSILHHGVPIDVMLNDYGCDDMDYLEQKSSKPGTITVQAGGQTYNLPIGRFDNRVDSTSFLRADPKQWNPAEVKKVQDAIKQAMDKVHGLKA